MTFSYAYQYGPDDISGRFGVPKPNQTVSVYITNTKNLATLYTSSSKSSQGPNPTTTDSLGNLLFFADPGTYDVTVDNNTFTVVLPVHPSEPASSIAVTQPPLTNNTDIATTAYADAATAVLKAATLPGSGNYSFSANGPTLFHNYSLGNAAGVTGLQVLPTGETFAVNAPKAGQSPGLMVGVDSTQGGLLVAYTGLNNQLYRITQPGSGQSFSLQLAGQTTGSLTAPQTATQIQNALNALTGISGCVAITTNVNGVSLVQVQTNGQGTLTASGATISGQTASELLSNHAIWLIDQLGNKIWGAGSRVWSGAGWYSLLGTSADAFHAIGWYGEGNPGSAGYPLGAPATNAVGSGHGYSYYHKYGCALMDIGSQPQLWGNGLNVYPLIAPSIQAAAFTPPSNSPGVLPPQYVYNWTPPPSSGGNAGTYTFTLNGFQTAAIDTTKNVYTLTPFGSYTLSLNGGTTSTIAFNAAASTIASDLNAIASGVTVTGTAGGPYTVNVPNTYTGSNALSASTGVGLSAITTVNVIQNALNALDNGAAPYNAINVTGTGLLSSGSPYQINYSQALGTLSFTDGTATGGTLTQTDFTASGALTGLTCYYAATGSNGTATESTLGPITPGIAPSATQAVQMVVLPSFGMGFPKVYRSTTATSAVSCVLTAGQTTITVNGGGNFPATCNGYYLQGTNILPGTYVVSGQNTATLTLNQAPVASTVTENVVFVSFAYSTPLNGLVSYVPSTNPNSLNVSGSGPLYVGYIFTDYGFPSQTGNVPQSAVTGPAVSLWGWLGEPETNTAFQIGDYGEWNGSPNLYATRGGNLFGTSLQATVYTVPVSSNAGTVPITTSNAVFTNSSAAGMTITMAVNNAIDGQETTLRIYDSSNVVQTIGWLGSLYTEDGAAVRPTQSNGSTTLPLTVRFRFNGQTSKWRCEYVGGTTTAGNSLIGQQVAYNAVAAGYNTGSMSANTWTAFASGPSITLPNDGATYEVKLFASSSNPSAAAGNYAIGIGTATTAILATMQTGGSASTVLTPVWVVAANVVGTGQTISVYGRATNASIQLNIGANTLNSGQQSPSYLCANRVK